MSYKEVAKLAGSPGAARAVGNIMKSNYDKSVPCHRVVRADRFIGSYSGGSTMKKNLLQKEGVQVKNSRVALPHIQNPLG